MPASLHARRRRSPAISCQRPSIVGRTLMGCKRPFCKMLTASFLISFSLNVFLA